jgi:hypothetical protein
MAFVMQASIMPAHSQSVSKENLLKAAFVFNFIKFVEWPDKYFGNSDTPIKLCIWGDSALDGALDTLSKKTAKKRSIQILYTRKIRAVAICHVLFVSESDRDPLQTIIRLTTGKSILTVSDIPDFAKRGGIIGLFRSEERMRFAINVDAARQSGLRISSQLLELGKIVSNERQ